VENRPALTACFCLRESLLKTPTPDVAAAKELVFTTDKEWEAWAEEGNVPSAAAARALAEALSVTIEEDKIAGVNVHRVTPSEIDVDHQNHLFVYIHGGAWVRNGGVAGALEAYRMPPEHPAPAGIDDVVAVWKELLKKRSPASMTLGGTSGGGNISLASVHRFRDLQLAFPGALYLGTPAVDIDMIGDSRFINEGIDRNLGAWEGIPREAGVMYAGDYDHKHPYISPIYGDFENFPPTYLISGTRDLLLSDAVRAHRKLEWKLTFTYMKARHMETISLCGMLQSQQSIMPSSTNFCSSIFQILFCLQLLINP